MPPKKTDKRPSLEERAAEAAGRILKTWYLHPAFLPHGTYGGVHLGRCAEQRFYLDLMRAAKGVLQAGAGSSGLPEIPPRPERMLLRWRRLPPWGRHPSAGARGAAPVEKPTVLACVRAQNTAVVEALRATESFRLVLEGHPEAIRDFREHSGSRFELFGDLITDEIRERSAQGVRALSPHWLQSLESPDFRNQFNVEGIACFERIREPLRKLFQDLFPDLALAIEALNRLAQDRRVALLVVWNDCLPVHRALILAAGRLEIPVLQVAHAIHGMDPANEELHADLTAVYGEYSRGLYVDRGNAPDRVVVTGNPDWDKYAYLRERVPREAACAALGLDPRRRWVLFASFWVAGPLAAVDPSFTESFYRGLLRCVRESRTEEGVGLLVKLHPAERDRGPWYRRIAVEEGVEAVRIETGHLEMYLLACDVLVCKGSNMAFEALLLEKPVVSYGPVQRERDAVRVVECVQDLGPAVRGVLEDPAVRAELADHRRAVLERYNHACDGQAARRVMALVEEMTGTSVALPQGFVPMAVGVAGGIPGAPEGAGHRRGRLEELVERGDLEDARGRPERAVELYQEACACDPEHPAPLYKLGAALLNSGRVEAALDTLGRLIELDSERLDARLLTALALYRKGDYPAALESLGFVIDSDAANLEQKGLAHTYRARCRRAAGAPAEAEASLRAALALDPDAKIVLRELADLCAEQGRWDEAREALEWVVRRNPHDAETLRQLGEIQFKAGRSADARETLRKALDAREDCADTLYSLVEILCAEGSLDEALDRVEAFLARHPDSRKASLLRKKIRRLAQ